MRYKSIFIDTWGWLALGHRRDNYHQAVKQLYYQLKQQKTLIYTSDYVLDELISLLFRRENFQEASTFPEGILQSKTNQVSLRNLVINSKKSISNSQFNA